MLKKIFRFKSLQYLNTKSSKLKAKSCTQGFTLVEIVVAAVILVMLITFASGVYSNFYHSYRNLRASNTVYQEGRFVMERIVQEIRNQTVDYEEYFDKSSAELGTPDTYGDNFCNYSRQFYSSGTDRKFGTRDDKNTGVRTRDPNNLTATPPPAINRNLQRELYLIDGSGSKRTYFKRIVGRDSLGSAVGQVAMLKLIGKDYGLDHRAADALTNKDEGEGDSFIDTWVCDEGFTCNVLNGVQVIKDSSFINITPNNLDVTDLAFIIAPLEDPRKGYNINSIQLQSNVTVNIQIQPNVTVKLTLRASKKIATPIKGNTPDITLESTVSSRVYNEVAAKCPLKECNNGETQACPRTLGVCTGAEQTCSENTWPGCTEGVYTTRAQSSGLRYATRENSEALCTDAVDNDCDGLADEFDPDCLHYFCTNGRMDTGLAPLDRVNKMDLTDFRKNPPPPLDENDPDNQDERCVDVGGLCKDLHSYEDGRELSCYDGYDNDCDYRPGPNGTVGTGGADEFDTDCTNVICSNNQRDFNLASTDPRIQARNYLVCIGYRHNDSCPRPSPTALGSFNQDEKFLNVGGLCVNASPPHIVESPEGSTLNTCFDGLDNDGNNLADEFDLNCKNIICGNRVLDNNLAPSTYPSQNYIAERLSNPPGRFAANNQNEVSIDSGGLCGTSPENTMVKCTNGIDDDGNELIDWRDPRCCENQTNNPNNSDTDGDGFFVLGSNNGLCQPPLANQERATCDTNPAVHPGIAESELALCRDSLDNDCNGTADAQEPTCCTDNDGDGYGILGNNFSCSASRTVPDCNDSANSINPGTIEVCDDQINNNCNELIDYADDFCVTQNQKTFFDNLSTQKYRSWNSDPAQNETTANWDGSGKITPTSLTLPDAAVSTLLPTPATCTRISRVTLSVDATTTGVGTSIEYYITNMENRWNRNRVYPDQEFRFPPDQSGTRLRWKAILQGNGNINELPELKSVKIKYEC